MEEGKGVKRKKRKGKYKERKDGRGWRGRKEKWKD
jgi:hypothetical protein